MKDEGLDKIFKKGLADRNVPFSMDSWRRMEQMLPPENKATTFAFSLSAAVVGALLLVTASLFFWNDDFSDIFADEIPGEATSVSADMSPPAKMEKTKVLGENTANNTSGSEEIVSEIESLEIDFQEGNLESIEVIGSEKSEVESTSGKSSSTNSFFAKNKTSNPGFFENISGDKFSENIDFSKREEDRNSLIPKGSRTLSSVEYQSFPNTKSNSENTLVGFVGSGNRPKVDRNVFGFIGGANFNNQLVPSSSNGIMVSEFFGVQYQRYLNSGFSFRANLLYSARNNVKSHKMFEEKVYDFGSTTAQTEVECNRMIYLELPLLVNYSLYRHNFLLGPNVSYLLNGYNDVTTHVTKGNSTEISEDSSWGYTDGFSSYDLSMVVGYEFEIKPTFSVGARLNYGFIDITDNAYFNSESFDNNVQWRIYLTISPFQF